MSLFESIGSRFRKLILEPSVKAQERPTQTISVIPRPTIINDHEPGVKAQERPETVSVIPGPVINEPNVTAEERQETVSVIPGPVVIDEHEPSSVTAKERQETVSVIPGPVVINDLPPEILAEIFLLASEFVPLGRRIDVNNHYGILRYRSSGPLSLVHVCRYWREIALSMQTLWRSFEATDFTPKAWAHWSSFSKSSPLQLGFRPDLRRGFDYGEGKDWDPERRSDIFKRRLEKSKAMLHQFAACADRWDCLYFECNNHQVTQAIADMLHTTASRSPLRKISINFPSGERTPSQVVNKLVSAIASFPSLREFISQDCPFTTLPRAPDFPWHALENIYIYVIIDLQECVHCLMHCTSARHVTLLGCGYRRITGAPKLVHSILPKLESLTIDDSFYPGTFLEYFTLPSLVYLEMRNLIGFSPGVEEFLVRSRCPLHTFKFTPGSAMQPDKIIASFSTPYLQTVPNVVTSISGYTLRVIMQTRSESDILRILPRFTTWDREEGLNWCKIGWRSLEAS